MGELSKDNVQYLHKWIKARIDDALKEQVVRPVLKGMKSNVQTVRDKFETRWRK